MKPIKTFVISISAVSGGGKTTITKRLCEMLPNCKALYFDDFDFEVCPDDISDWVERGSDYNEWDLTPFVNDLKSLLKNSEEPLEFIVLDYPFSRRHDAVKDYIDFTLFLDTPLDIAMARRLIRDYSESDKSMKDLCGDAINYLSRARSAYLGMQTKERNQCDLVVDGSKAVNELVEYLYKRIKELCMLTQ